MNRIFRFVFICILLSVLFSCKKSYHIGTGGTVTANVNGVPYVSATVSGEANPGKAAFSIFTSANSAKTEGITLYIDSLRPGIYSFNSGSGNALQYNRDSISYGSVPGSGYIIIDSASNNTISGIFNGVLGIGNADSIVITDGSFTKCAY